MGIKDKERYLTVLAHCLLRDQLYRWIKSLPLKQATPTPHDESKRFSDSEENN